MNYLKPYLGYLLSAILLCVIYFGLERSHGTISFLDKSIMCSWSIISIIITCALFSIETSYEEFGTAPAQITAVTFGASIITLCASSSLVYCAR